MRTLSVSVLCVTLATTTASFRLLADPTVATWTDPVKAVAEILPRTSKGLLLDIVRSGDRLLAVGERGAIIHSSDGKTWTQAAVPTRATLTAISVSGDRAWAVGHDGVILRSEDRGTTWSVQRTDPLDVSKSSAQRDPRQGAPLLDVLFVDADHGYAVGSYNQMLSTSDGGSTWTPLPLQTATPAVATPAATGADAAAATTEPVVAADAATAADKDRYAFNDDELELGAESDPHLNGIARTGSGGLFVVSERGSAFRSRDAGVTWQRLQLPYDGSMFGVIGYEGDHVLVYGLRGNVFESTDLGDSWKRIDSGTEFSLMGGVALDNDGAVLVGANGTVLARRSGVDAFKSNVDLAAGALAGVLPGSTDQLLVVGENGVNTVVIP